MTLSINSLQPLGRALMLPIAVLPVAALLLRCGQPDLLDIAFIASAGAAIFSNLGPLFAIGVAIGIARENHGAAGLAGMVCFLVVTEGAKALLAAGPDAARFADPAANELALAAWKTKELAKLSVPAGIVSGVVSGWLYNRYSTIKLPEYLGFFAGRRFVPIAAGLAGLVGALIFGLGFPALEAGVDTVSKWALGAGGFGLFVYGVLNRLLIVTGLHHILNNLAWFIIGDYQGATGDLNRFFAGDPSAGQFMSGFFPVMMFGLPAACLAMYRAACPERRRAVAGIFLSLGLTSFLTGVTEPIEFTFMFLAPALYGLHAVLTGASMVLMDWLQVRLGFGFSAGLFDYVLNFGLATRPLLLIPVGLAYFAFYYVAFSWCIRRFNLQTPGREIDSPVREPDANADMSRASGYLEALGGRKNLTGVEACTTRLRLTLNDPNEIDESALKALGARGIVRPGKNALQVVVGPIADQLAGEIRNEIATGGASPALLSGEAELLECLGSAANILEARACGARIIVSVVNATRINVERLASFFPRGVMVTASSTVHLLSASIPASLERFLRQPTG